MNQVTGNLCKVLIAIERRKHANGFLTCMQLIGQSAKVTRNPASALTAKGLVIQCDSHSVC